MTRILVLVPHPDDEVVGCAVAIRRAVAAGDVVFTLYLTTGVPARDTVWPWQRAGYGTRIARRRAEAEAVAQRLSLTPLGFQPWPSRTLKDHIGEALDLIRSTIADYAIDEIWVPAWEGAHQDHDTANVIAAQLRDLCPITEFAEYNYAGGAVRSCQFAAANGTERTLSFTPDEERWKTALLAIYRSECANLAHCHAGQESLRPLPAYDYAQAPHDGRLFYARFQWIPFRHPRVDFDSPDVVRTRLADALHR